MAKKPPNPYGSPGAPDHQAAVQRLKARALVEFRGKPVRIEENASIKDTGVNRRPDVTVRDEGTGKVLKVYEAARMNKDGSLVAREQKKLTEYKKAGIPYEVETVK